MFCNRKLLLSLLSLISTVISPLTSCGSDGSSNDIGGFDKEFGFDVQTYNRLESEFKTKYRSQLLEDNTIDKNVAFDKYDDFLQNDISIMRNKLFDPAQNYSFTVRTNALLDYASKNYNIYLKRDTNISETDFSNLKQSSLENFVIYLDNVYGIDDDEKDKQITKFSEAFDQLLFDITLEYNDKAEILLRLRAGIIDCWQDLDKEFALLSASNHLKDFFDNYQFIVKDQSEKQTDINELLWDNLLSNEEFINNGKTGLIDQDIDCQISDQWINKLFIISKKKNYTDDNSSNKQGNSISDILLSYKEVKDFNSQEIIPGYTLTPVLKTMSQDIYANEYYINIDWQLVSNKYKNETNQKIKDSVTAHIAYNKDGQVVDDFDDQQLSSDDYQFTKYNLLATPTCQKENLAKAYKNISLSWDKQKIGIEYFLPSNAYDENFVVPNEPYNLAMTQDNLSELGLQLNGTSLSNLLDKQKKSLDNETIDNTNNLDDNLKIEEKFVKYCTISAISTITFNDKKSITKNNILNTFVISYKNTEQDISVADKTIELNDVSASTLFLNTAIEFYKNVANFVDTQKITRKIDSSKKLSLTIKIEIGIMVVEIIALLIAFILTYFFDKKTKFKYDLFGNDNKKSNNKNYASSEKKIFIMSFIIIAIFAITLYMIWYCSVAKPISDQVEKIKNWNNAITNKTKYSYIKVINKVNGDDKNHFKSYDAFSKYFTTNSLEAFASYFYYFHFNNILSTNDENMNDINKQIKDDYDQFNKTKKDYDVTIDKDRIKWLLAIIFAIFLLLLFSGLLVCLLRTWRHMQLLNKVNKEVERLNKLDKGLGKIRARFEDENINLYENPLTEEE